MAINFPDTSVNNPGTNLPWSDGDQFVDPPTGLIYVWMNPVWKREISPTGATDTKYVEVLGDHMSGSLTVGGTIASPNISVGSNGSLLVEDMVTVGAYAPGDSSSLRLATTSYGGQVSIRVNAAQPTEPSFNIIGSDNNTYFEINNEGRIQTNDDFVIKPINGSENVKLSADGSATFTGQITLPGGGSGSQAITVDEVDTKITTVTDGVYLEVAGDNMDGNLTVGGDKIILNNDGSAVFAGNVTTNNIFRAGNPTSSGDSTGVGLDGPFGEIAVFKGTGSSDNGFRIYNQSNNTNTVEIKKDGSAEFSNYINAQNSITSERAGATSYCLRTRDTDTDNLGFVAKADGTVWISGDIESSTPNISLNSDGSANFAGIVNAGGNALQGRQTGTQLRNDGLVIAVRPSGQTALAIYPTSPTGDPVNATAAIKTDGSAKFAGPVAVGGLDDAHTMDEYEEGTWTPRSNQGSATFDNTTYVRVGKKVTIICNMYNFTDRVSNSSVSISGLPYASEYSSAAGSVMGKWLDSGAHTTYVSVNNNIELYQSVAGNWRPLLYSDLNSTSSQFYLIATYFTNQ